MKGKTTRRICSWLTIVAMCVTMLPGPMWASAVSTQVTTSPTEKIVQVGGHDVYVPKGATSPGNVSSVKKINAQTTNLTSGWYIVVPAATPQAGEPDVKMNDRMVVNGDVHLILAEGATLQAVDGIQVESGNSLTIWGQQAKSTGTLLACSAAETAQTNVAPISDDENAAIGGNKNNDEYLHTAGTITINGGSVEAVSSTGAAIGGGYGSNRSMYGGAAGAVIINDGVVIARSISGAGIGGGNGAAFAGAGGAITIRGGAVDASSVNGAGIGAGQGHQGAKNGSGTVSITGGNVQAVSNSGAGIGAGLTNQATKNAGADVTISGGTVTAQSVDGAAIGGGDISSQYGIGQAGSFSTGTDGHAVISASSLTQVGIADTSKRGQWSGVIFDGKQLSGKDMLEGQIYGSPTLQGNVLLPEKYAYKDKNSKDHFVKYQLHIAQDKTLTIGQGATLTNEMPIYCAGTITNHGTIDNTKGDIGQATNLKATFRVVNGSWADGTTGDMTGVTIYKKAPQREFAQEEITFETQALMQSQIPTGMQPDLQNYPQLSAEGTWRPATDQELTENKTFTYTFSGRQPYAEPTIQYDFLTSKLKGFEQGGSYTIDGHKANPESDGTLPIKNSWFNSTISIQRQGDAAGDQSTIQFLAITARPSAPTDLDTQRTTGSDTRDGKFKGLLADKSYEYSENVVEENWQPVAAGATEITGLAPGTYLVREKATATRFASASANVNVEGPEAYALEIAPVSFAAIAVGDNWPAAKAIEITNTGTQEASITAVTVAPTDAFELAGSDNKVPAGGSLNTWTIQPKAGLPAGKHEATITVTYNGAKTATAKVTFTVLPKQNQPAVQIDYINEQLTGFEAGGMYAIANGTPQTIAGTSIPAAPYMGKTIAIVHKGDGTTVMDSVAQSLEVPVRTAAPTGLQGQAPSQKGRSDGKITGLAKAKHYEYQASGAQGWKTVADDATDITGLPAGTYQVREAAKADAFASSAADVIVKEGAAPPVPPTPPTPPVKPDQPVKPPQPDQPVKPDTPGTTVHPDGSTTTVVTKPDGTITTTTEQPNGNKVSETKKPDGTQIVEKENAKGDKQTETKQPDGTKITEKENAKGDTSKEVQQPDGSATIDISKADGSQSTTTIDKNGQQATQAVVSDKAVEEAVKTNKPVITPTPAKETPKAEAPAPVLEIQVPKTVTAEQPLTIVVPVENLAPSDVLVLVHEDGKEEIVRKSIGTEDGIKMQITGDVHLKVVNNEQAFNDIAGHWAADAIDNVTSRGIFNGVGGGQFAPDVTTNRAMLVTVLHNLENNPEQSFDGDFNDVADNAWYAESVKWAAENGIVSGVGDNNFAPEDTLTREQMVTMLYRYAGSPKVEGNVAGQFSDSANISGYARDAMNWAISKGIVNGVGNNTLAPQGQATRAQLAIVITKLMQL